VAGVTLSVEADRPTVALSASPLHRPFLARRGGDIRLRLVEERPPAPSGGLLFESEGVWRVYEHEGGWLYTFETHLLEPRLYKAVWMHRSFRRGTLYFPRPERGRRPRSALDFPLDELLFQHYLARRGSFEVHACAVDVGGRAALFCGQSGAGKSTTAKLWHRRGARVLSDDRVVLSLRKGRPWAFGTPWHGLARFALDLGLPLAGIFFLEHAETTTVQALAPSRAAAQLFSRGFPPPWDRAGLDRALHTCARIVSKVPAYRFAFRPDRSAVEAVLAVLAR
jgi:hypothetical protein